MAKKYTDIGYIRASENTALDDFMSLTKDLQVLVDGNAIDTKYLQLPKYLTAYDKSSKKEVILGKLVKREVEGELRVYFQFNDNVSFRKDGNVLKNKFGSLKSTSAQLDELEKSLQDEKISEDNYNKVKEAISSSKAKVTIVTES